MIYPNYKSWLNYFNHLNIFPGPVEAFLMSYQSTDPIRTDDTRLNGYKKTKAQETVLK